ncbi:MAG: hypothetical protein ACTHJ4_03955 [Candidatus Nucleicultricaceae bacterium]
MNLKKTKTSVFISIMGSAAVIILAFNVYLTTVNLVAQKQVSNANFTKESIDKLWLLPNQLLAESKNARPEFLASFYYNNQALYERGKNLETPITIKSELDEQYIGILLIQCWEDYLTLRILDETGDNVWLYNFLQWAQSPYLKAIFDRLKYNFANTTIMFGELLFDYAKKIPIPTTDPEYYNHKVKELLQDPHLHKIYALRQAQS